MAILHQLGVGPVAIYQFIIFVLIISFLSTYLFKPFFEAAEKRLQQTTGAVESGQELERKISDLEKKYQEGVRYVNEQIQTVFQAEKKLAEQQADQILSAARAEGQSRLEAKKTELAKSIQSVQADIPKQAKELATLVIHKLLSK